MKESGTRIASLVRLLSPLLLLVVVLCLALPGRPQAPGSANPFSQLHYRFLGPLGNRADAVVGVPGDPLVDYIGAAAGGIWKTEDGGVHWESVFDNVNVAAIGNMTLDPSDPNTVWVGTGEPFQIRPWVSMGNGVYKSTDAGRTWHHMGLEATGHISRIIVNPQNSNDVYVCAPGQLYGPQHERGIFKSTDGSQNWQQVLFVNEDTGCSELSMKPRIPTRYSPACGKWRSGRGVLAMAVWAAVSTSPTMPAPPGRNSPVTACPLPINRWGRWRCRWLRAIRTASTC